MLLVNCSETTGESMTVSGNVKGLKKGVLYLQKVADSTLITLDSLEINGDGNFSFETALESPEIFYLYLNKEDKNDVNDRITFFGEPGIITINSIWNAFDTKAVIEGSETHKKLEEYRKVMTRFNTQNLELISAANNPETQEDMEVMDSLRKANDKNILRSYLYSLNFALNNKNSHIAPYIALTEVSDANIIYLDSIYNSLSPEVANAKYGRALEAYLEGIRSNQ
ncbi:MAG: DUF4369 domain-containing protein, partial [Muriicola sp.]|nr:DUF4369 domain-containing protein [Muriicola sp.]